MEMSKGVSLLRTAQSLLTGRTIPSLMSTTCDLMEVGALNRLNSNMEDADQTS